MILELNSPYALNLEEDVALIGNYQKSKKKSESIYDLRFLFKGIKTGKEHLFFLKKEREDPFFKNSPFGGDRVSTIGVFNATDSKIIAILKFLLKTFLLLYNTE